MLNKKFVKINSAIIISFILSIIIIIVFYFSVSFQRPSDPKLIDQKTYVSFCDLNEGNENEILNDQALVFDTKPIFLPSKWNEKQISPTKITDNLFQDLLPQTMLYPHETLAQINTPELSTLLSLDTLNKKLIHPFEGINQERSIFPSIKSPSAHIVIKNFNHSDIIETYEVNNENPLLQETFWAPLEFLVTVDESGLIMPLLISRSSGIENIDNFFKNTLCDPLLKLSHLPVGYYKITINP